MIIFNIAPTGNQLLEGSWVLVYIESTYLMSRFVFGIWVLI